MHNADKMSDLGPLNDSGAGPALLAGSEIRQSFGSEERQVQSLEDQLSELQDLAQRLGIVVSEVIVESKSAKEPNTRPEFQRLIRMIETGQITGLLTWHTNRLARNMVDGGIIAHLLQTGKLDQILTPQRRYLPQDSAMLLAIENGMATSYIQDLSRAVKRGMKGKVERGWLPGPAPLGYVNNRLTHTIEPHPTKFAIVKKGWELVLKQDYTQVEVQREWERLGLRGERRGNSKSAPSTSSVHRMLSNPFYAGQIRAGGRLHQGAHEPMISMAEFEGAQALLHRVARRRQQTHTHSFSGMFRCPTCGCRIVGELKTKRSLNGTTSYTYYHCTGFKGCSKRGLSEDVVLMAIRAMVDRIKITPSLHSWMRQEVLRSASEDLQVTSSSLATLESQEKQIQQRLRSLLEMRLNAELSSAEYAAHKHESVSSLVGIDSRRRSLEDEGVRVRNYALEKLDAADQAGRFEEVSREIRRGILRSLGDERFLNLEELVFELDPVIAKIATFEPLRTCSQSPKVDDSALTFSIWRGRRDSNPRPPP